MEFSCCYVKYVCKIVEIVLHIPSLFVFTFISTYAYNDTTPTNSSFYISWKMRKHKDQLLISFYGKIYLCTGLNDAAIFHFKRLRLRQSDFY